MKIGDGKTAWDDLPYLATGFKDRLTEKLERMLAARYIKIRHEEFSKTKKPFSGLEPSGWLSWTSWMDEHGISYSPMDDHVELELMGRPIYMPKEFADKALVLDYMP